MLIIIYILTFFLVLDCLFLGLLILMQLPKKEAGLGGAAFGGGAVDALIGAGSGNVLTKVTKYAAIAFFLLVIVLSLLYTNYAKRDTLVVEQVLEKSPPAQTTPVALPSVLGTNSTSPAPIAAPISASTNTPAAPQP